MFYNFTLILCVVTDRSCNLFSFSLTEKLYLIMEYCEGGDLRKVINYQRGRPENLFGTDIVLGWFTQLCLALQYIHKQNILHRDVTPSNVFLSADGTVKLGDFGLAKIMQYQSQMRTSGGDNSVLYQPPEMTLSGQPASTKCDMFAVGCVLYELCTGSQPFESPSLSQSLKNACRSVYKSLPSWHGAELRSLVDRLLSANPYERPSADDVLRETFLKRFVTHFSPRDTGSSMSMRDEVTSSGQTVTEVLQSIRVAMSGSGDGFYSESEIGAPPNTPTIPMERSFPDIPKMFSSAVTGKRDPASCQWFDTGRNSSRQNLKERYLYRTDNSDKRITNVRSSATSSCLSPRVCNKSEVSEKSPLQKVTAEVKSMISNLRKLDSSQNGQERFASTL